MFKELRPAALAFLVLTLLTGVIYPLIVTAFAQLFPSKATGSVIEVNGKAVGSELIGQPFSDPKYFWSRPSATSPQPYNGASSSGSNLGPTNKALAEAVAERLKQFERKPVPVDLVTASASGLDPHISPEAAHFQVSRVAMARGLTEEAVNQLVSLHTEGRTFGVLGEPRVNVLKLNLALDALK
ncbi:MAG TPA: potassium-transporting ATPase subunit KdpC [Burkholderiales bacterium]|nr:potassium-transporting ATPase subunit KdpC [Burkholderiales bacterium]